VAGVEAIQQLIVVPSVFTAYTGTFRPSETIQALKPLCDRLVISDGRVKDMRREMSLHGSIVCYQIGRLDNGKII
jgi:hypothetical protein